MEESLYFKRIGKGAPLVLIHGWGWSSLIWEPLLSQLSEHFEVTLVDLPGFGQSPLELADYSFEAIAPLLFECVPDRAIWLGWSLGGMLAWWVAIHFPDRVERLITVASSPRFVSDDGWPGVESATLSRFAGSLENNFQQTLADFLELQLRGSADYQTLLAELQRQIEQAPPAIEALEGGLKLLQTTDLRDGMTAVKCPTLHLFGQRDRIVPVAVTALLAGETDIFSKSGHLLFLSEKEKFLAAIKRFAAVDGAEKKLF